MSDLYEPVLTGEPDNRQWEEAREETEFERTVRLIIALRRVGVSEQVSADLTSGYPLDRIEQQLAWLPYRRPKRKASLIVAAIKGDYEKPVVLEDGSNGA